MKLFKNYCSHNYVRISDKPERIKYDCSGFKSGFFQCECTKCHKKEILRFLM